jgi:hypothetical protein
MARSQTIPQTASQTIIDSSLTVCRIVVIAVAVITEFIDPPTPARSSGIINLADTRQQLGLAGASVLTCETSFFGAMHIPGEGKVFLLDESGNASYQPTLCQPQ